MDLLMDRAVFYNHGGDRVGLGLTPPLHNLLRLTLKTKCIDLT